MNDPLSDIHHYSPTMTIAQVIKFCEKKDIPLSRAMIQNYIRDGLLPPPTKRQYTHKHLAALAVISRLKTVYDIPAIRDVIAPHLDGEGLPLDVYRQLYALQKESLDDWIAKVAPGIAAQPEDLQDILIMVEIHRNQAVS